MAGWLTYANQGATRSQPLNQQLVNALSFLPDLGVSMEVFSGGQPSSGPNRTGSHRHDEGNAGDVFFSKNGRQLDWANPQDQPIFQDIVQRARAAGVTGIGAGEGYMRPGSMHIGFGTPAVWGAGGSGANAPGWLRAAYGSGGSGGVSTTPAGAVGNGGTAGAMAAAIDPRAVVLAQLENNPWKAVTDVGPKRGGLLGEGSAGGGEAAAPGADPGIPPIETAQANMAPDPLAPPQSPIKKLGQLAQLFKVAPQIGAAAEGQALPIGRA
jgi:hypothetical protein